jgi:hypothetical protein
MSEKTHKFLCAGARCTVVCQTLTDRRALGRVVLADIEENRRRKVAGETEIPASPIAIEIVRHIDALLEIVRRSRSESRGAPGSPPRRKPAPGR